MDQKGYQRRRLVEWLTAEITRATGRRYSIKLDTLDDESLRELQRLLRDLDHEKQMAVQQAWACSGRKRLRSPSHPALSPRSGPISARTARNTPLKRPSDAPRRGREHRRGTDRRGSAITSPEPEDRRN